MPKSLSQLTAQIKKLQKEAEAIKAKELDGVIARIKEAIQRYGLTATDLGLTKSRARRSGTATKIGAKTKRGRPQKARKGKGVIKYRSADGQQSWTGHGRAPNWFKAALESGTTRESLTVR